MILIYIRTCVLYLAVLRFFNDHEPYTLESLKCFFILLSADYLIYVLICNWFKFSNRCKLCLKLTNSTYSLPKLMLVIAKFKEIWSLDSLLTLVKLRLVCHSSKIMQGADKVKSSAGLWATLQSLSVVVNAYMIQCLFLYWCSSLWKIIRKHYRKYL